MSPAERDRLELEAAIEQARFLGFKVWQIPESETIDGDRVRCEVGRYLNDGIFYVVLYAGQNDGWAHSALQVALRRLMRFDEETWFVKVDAERERPVPVATVHLCDVGPYPMEFAPDARRTMDPYIPS